jgi:hypothetical protein
MIQVTWCLPLNIILKEGIVVKMHAGIVPMGMVLKKIKSINFLVKMKLLHKRIEMMFVFNSI